MLARSAGQPISASPTNSIVNKHIVHTDRAPAAIGPYSQGVIANGLLFTAGQIALDPASGQVVPGGVAEQTERVFKNLTAVLESAGTSWSNVLKTTVYLQDMRDFPAVNEVYARMVGEARPARSTVAVSGLPRGVLVEIDAVATVDKK
jgi:2-iminobutanoate/2-iminopropanoate deaminase